MKILHDDRTTSITATTPFSASNFPIANVQNDKLNSRYIPSAAIGGTTATITANFDGSASNKVQAFFVAGLMADSATYSFQNAAGDSVHETGTLTTADLVNSDIGGNKNTLNNYFVGQDNYTLSQFIIFENPQSADCRLVVTLTTSTDRKSQTSNGEAIASWEKTASTTGRFLDSGGTAVNLRDHGRVLVGSQVVIGGESIASIVATNTTISANSVAVSPLTINTSITLSINVSISVTIVSSFPQISSYTGSGTATGSVTLSEDLNTQAVTSIINPIRVGIFRGGSVLDIPNPQIGFSNSLIDYSTRRRLTNGGYQYKQFNIGKSVGLSFVLTNAQSRTFEDFVRAYRSKPFAGLFLADMTSAEEPTTRYSGFYYLQNAPETSFDIDKTASNVSTSFTLNEIF
jgi:hypothetical protein